MQETHGDGYWSAGIRRAGKLQYFAIGHLGPFHSVLTAAIHWFNAQSRLNFVPARSESAAHVLIEIGDPMVSFEGYPEPPDPLPAIQTRGLTLPSAKRQDKVKIFLPANPCMSVRKIGARPTGGKVKKYIITHELFHAAGLDEHSDASLKDAFCDGEDLYDQAGDKNAEEDSVWLKGTSGGSDGNPRNQISGLFPLNGNATAQRLNAIWP